VKLHDDKLLHISWIEYQPLPNVNCNKEGWSELLEYHSYSSRLHMVIPESAVFVYITGLVRQTLHILDYLQLEILASIRDAILL
jgi:hypothetical protein